MRGSTLRSRACAAGEQAQARAGRGAGTAAKACMWRRAMPCMAVMPMALALAACGARPAPGIRGHWTPMDPWPSAAVELPLAEAYVYVALPTDRTLKATLERWARDTGRSVSYRHRSDFTLHRAVAGIRTTDSRQAIAGLNDAYRQQGIVLSIEPRRIVAEPQASMEPPGAIEAAE